MRILGGLSSPVALKVAAVGRGHLKRAEAQYVADQGATTGLKKVQSSAKMEEEVMPEMRKIDESEVRSLNYYQLLGLDAMGLGVDDDLIKRAYRQALLLYHPDKNSDQVEEFNGDAKVFLAVQKAYEILSVEQSRRAYDSTNQFDDDIPTGREEKDDPDYNFYATYGPVFKSNGRFATTLPVPDLGDDTTDEATVEAFYTYWFSFESWRDFGLEAREHDPETAEDRFEKRWMAKENDKLAKKRKKEEYARIVTLVERSRANDPRIKRFADQRADKKKRAKQLKADAELAKDVAAKAMATLEALEKERVDKLKADESKERKAAREKLKKAKRRAEKALWAIIVQGRQVFDDVMDDAAFEELSATLEPDDLVALAEIAEPTAAFHSILNDALASKRSNPHRKLHFDKKNRHLDEATTTMDEATTTMDEATTTMDEATTMDEPPPPAKNGNNGTKNGGHNGSNGGSQKEQQPKKNGAKAKPPPWSDEELSMLAKAIKKFPAGARQRWEGIADYVSTQLRLTRPRTKDECIQKYHDLQSTPKAEVMAKRATEQPTTKRATEQPPTSSDWTQDQQKDLERGLAKYPPTLEANERWKLIASEVNGKTKRECVERYKELRKAVQANAAAAKTK